MKFVYVSVAFNCKGLGRPLMFHFQNSLICTVLCVLSSYAKVPEGFTINLVGCTEFDIILLDFQHYVRFSSDVDTAEWRGRHLETSIHLFLSHFDTHCR